MKSNATNSLAHTTWNCKYHIVLPIGISITQGFTFILKAKSWFIWLLTTKPMRNAPHRANIWSTTGQLGPHYKRTGRKGWHCARDTGFVWEWPAPYQAQYSGGTCKCAGDRPQQTFGWEYCLCRFVFLAFEKGTAGELSLTQMQMAEVIGIGQTTYSDWEREARIPRRKEHNKILVALKKLKVNVDTYLCQSTSIWCGAEFQVGNVGGELYWSWYRLNNRVE